MTCLGPNEMFYFSNLMFYCYQILSFLCLIIWKHKNKFSLFLQWIFFLRNSVLCIAIFKP